MFRLIIVILTLPLLLISFSSQAYAYSYNTFNDHVLTGGVGDYGNYKRYYYITFSAGSESSLIDESMNDWIYTTNTVGITTPISFRKTSVQSSSVIDLYKGDYFLASMGILGATYHYRYSESVDPESENWGWARIILNTPNYDTRSNYGKKAIIAHEIGHAFGLDHYWNQAVLMFPQEEGHYTNKPARDDLIGINHLY